MSLQASPEAAQSEAAIEGKLRELVAAAITSIDRTYGLFGCCWLVIMPLLLLLFFRYFQALDWWATLLRAGAGWLAGFVVGVVAAGLLDDSYLRRAVRRFNECFPEGQPDRLRAIGILGEMESPSRVERRLLDALSGGGDAQLVRRPRQEATVEDQIQGVAATVGASPGPAAGVASAPSAALEAAAPPTAPSLEIGSADGVSGAGLAPPTVPSPPVIPLEPFTLPREEEH